MHRKIVGLGAMTLALLWNAGTRADVTITLESDGSTQAAALVEGAPDAAQEAALDTGNTSGLAFQNALVGAYGTFTQPPSGAPAGTKVINIPPGDGESGFFEVMFTLPSGFSNASLSGAGNVDDQGTVFLNGTAITPVNALDESDSVFFSTADPSLFHAGTNVLLISDSNSGGGPSGAAFYADVTYNGTLATPEPSSMAVFGFGLTVMGATAAWRRRRTAA